MMELRINRRTVDFDTANTAPKMGLRWWRDVLIRNQAKRYLDDRLARKYCFVSFRKTR